MDIARPRDRRSERIRRGAYAVAGVVVVAGAFLGVARLKPVAAIDADYQKARMQADMNEALAARQLVSELVRRQSQLDADQLAIRHKLAEEQLAKRADGGEAQIAVQQSSVDQARAMANLKA